MVTFTPFSAKNAMIRVGVPGQTASTVFTGADWDVEPASSGLIDSSNFEGAGFEDWIGSMEGASFNVSNALYDAMANLYDNPPNIRPNRVISLRLYLWLTSGPYWESLYALIDKVPMKAAVKDGMRVSFSGKFKASFSYPTGTTWSSSGPSGPSGPF